MGAGLLPITIHKGTIFLLLGQERSNKWSDFGGTPNPNESNFNTAIREGGEELNGFLGSGSFLKAKVNDNFIKKVVTEDINKSYTSYLFYIDYDENLEIYFNNNNKFNEKYLQDKINIRHNGLFEKKRIKWFKISELKINLRPFYNDIINQIIKNKKEIERLIKK